MKTFIFPGQGSQIMGMGKDFYDNFDVSKEVFQEVNEVLNKDLSKIIFEGDQEILTQTENAQPALMCVSIAILRAIEKKAGKKINELCNFVSGHSLGEYTALCASGAISLKDTAMLLKIRGEAFAKVGKSEGGSMAAIIGATMEQVNEVVSSGALSNEVCQIANDNSPGQVIISGHSNSIDNAIKIATEIGIKRAMRLPVSGAFHSELMNPAIKDMEQVLNSINIQNPSVKFYANVTANETPVEKIKDNLLLQITNNVRWRETVDKIISAGSNNFVEIGAGVVLSKMISRGWKDVNAISINSISSMEENIANL